MYLKRLEVQGFKSFANKTALDFGTGVTCIVGPNGCGKTNVADSLRWVLGEHASRTLRARKTEDVIFAGSDKRSAMGVAEVNITLDNAEQWLPIEFNEVVVTRRAYRDGENEYFINGSKVRLRDIVELFMRAQVGQNSYAFMGQGMVEQVLSLRPEDRRALIEEAAEVRLHRNKLEDAQAKLKATRENLDRVNLLVREIQPRITQLEKQASRAVRYQELTGELAAALHVWYAQQWQDINAQLLAAIATHDQRCEEFDQAQAEVKALDDGLTQLRAAIDERREEIAARDARLRNLQDYARDLERRAALDAERSKLLAERLGELSTEIAALREEDSAQPAGAPTSIDGDREAALATARAALEQHRARLAAAEQTLLEVQRSALRCEQEAVRAREAADDLTLRLADCDELILRLRAEAARSHDERGNTIGEIASWARKYAALFKQTRDLLPRLDAAASERSRLIGSLEIDRRALAAIEQEMRELRSEVERIELRRELMESVDVAPQLPDAGVRLILEAGGVLKRENVPADVELSGVMGLVGQLVRVPPGLEKAIEAALAESLFAVVLQRQSDVRKALALLLTSESGRATLYALEELQEVRPLHLIKERGVVGVASQLVRCDGRYRRLIDTLLGRTVIVEDLALAQRIIRRGLAGAVATTDGVLLRPVGSVAAGTISSVEATFVRERELGDLPEQLEELRPRLLEREDAARDAAHRLEADEATSAALERELDALRQRKSEHETRLSTMRGGLATLRVRARAGHAARAEAQDQLATHDRARATMTAELASAHALSEQAALAEQSVREAIIAAESERASLSEAVTEHAAVVAHLDGELRTERHAGDGERIARERLRRQIVTKDEQRTKLGEEAHAIGSRLAATQRELSAKTSEIEALASELEPARRELAQFESHERELTASLADAGLRLRTAERAQFDAESDVRLRRDERESLRQSIEAEGFVANDGGEVERQPQYGQSAVATDVRIEEREFEGPVDPDGLPSWLRDDEPDDELPAVRGGSAIDTEEVRDKIADLRAQIRSLGPVNEQATADYSESRERYDFLTGQIGDLNDAEAQLNDAIGELEGVIRERFRTTFKTVNREFERYFSAFFRGGTARLELGETGEDGLPGIEIIAQPPGKKLGSLALLSGGERSLTAVALLFALLQANPSPICVLDEVDAALDEANVGRFVEELRELSQRTQFIIITHNRRTIETADTIYGVSMAADNVSRVLSLRLADVQDELE